MAPPQRTCLDHPWMGQGAFWIDDQGNVGCLAASYDPLAWYWEDFCKWYYKPGECDAKQTLGPQVDNLFRDTGNSIYYDKNLRAIQTYLKSHRPRPTVPPPPPRPPVTNPPQPPPTSSPSSSPPTTTTTHPPTNAPTTSTATPQGEPTTPPSLPPTQPSPATTTAAATTTTTSTTVAPTDAAPTTTSTTTLSTTTPTPTQDTGINLVDMVFDASTHAWTCLPYASVFAPVRRDNSTSFCVFIAPGTTCQTFASTGDCTAWLEAQLPCLASSSCMLALSVQEIPRIKPGSPNATTAFPPTHDNTTNPTTSSNVLNSVLLGVLGAAVVVAAIVGVVLYRRRRRGGGFRDDNDSIFHTDGPLYVTEKGHIPVMGSLHIQGSSSAGLTDVSSSTHHATSSRTTLCGGQLNLGELSLWRLDETQLSLGRVLSVGASGVVAMGLYKGAPVAVKKLNRDHSLEMVQSFIDEIKLMTKLDCPYILSITGCCWGRPRDIHLVMEFMEHGDLRQYLKQTPPTVFTWDLKRSVIHNMTQGLLYLHSMDIIHRDLKSRNVLLGHHLMAKLTDFGVSRELTIETMTRGVGSFRWTAPEILEGKRYTEAADIYSLGMIVWELDTHEAPYVSQQAALKVTDPSLMSKIRTGGIFPEFSATCPQDVEQFVLHCIDHDPLQRPTALDLSAHV
ncbi:Aste57867_10472 [Aphanomyces stellatus]|uniref:Aste57867_10472 protein n=1 Tax=Aphanomyces stellatus TaxID=120398 RepID=A0A485KQJ3_9STRA|nr:hypothetical protein As57867_010432 [Aphanomyces stellatus]VFT87346.1 Aste57867_10472 [Aphanomyces stellatus]